MGVDIESYFREQANSLLFLFFCRNTTGETRSILLINHPF